MNQTLRRILWAAALLVLAVLLILVNLPGERSAALGAQPGEQMPDFTARCFDGSVFTLSEQRGKVVVINLWATWCTPCVRELPYFDRLLRERPDEVAVLALHAPPVTADVGDWLSAYSYALPFAVDEEGDISALCGASSVLPQTLIIDPEGIVTCNHVGSLDDETLAALVNAALR